MSGKYLRALFSLTLIATLSGYSPARSEAPCGQTSGAGSGFETASLVEAKLDPAILCALGESLERRPEANVHAVVVLRDGKLVFETYRTGDDRNWGTKLGTVTYTPQMLHDVRSVSKSVVSLLIGIAIDRNLITSVNEPVFKYFPEYASIKTSEKDAITLRDLLTMSAGLGANENVAWGSPSNTERQMYESPDPYRTVLDHKVWNKPGEVWNYNSGCTMLLAAILRKVTGLPLAEFAREALFDPLGIKEFDWTSVKPSGEPAAGGGLRLLPRDMAKIGQLILNRGEWNGVHVVSSNWIDESTVPRYPAWGSRYYGYQWWVGESAVGTQTHPWVAAWGLGGQRIFIVRDLNLVVAITAGMYASDRQDGVVLDIFEDFALAAVKN